MTCESCAAALADRLSGLYSSGRPFFTASAAHAIVPAYRDALRLILRPGESIESAHKRVLEWDRHIRSTGGLL